MKTYLVGGAVRDVLLGLGPKDRDWVIVGATDEDVQRMLDEGYEQVGADFPVFLHPQTGEEHALARVERKTGVGYGGFTVDTENVTLEEDLMRRDLTINSMAIDPDGNIIDPYNGQEDLKNKVLRHTSPAFAEDPLRVLRLARFYARYSDFTIAGETIELCRSISASDELDNLSVERIWVELEKGFSETCVDRFMQALEMTHALSYCTVLQRTFGSMLSKRQLEILGRLTDYNMPNGLRMVVGIAAISMKWSAGKHKRTAEDRKPALIGAPKRLVSLYDHLHHVFLTKRSAVDLQALLSKTGAYKEGTSFNDLILVIEIMEGNKRFEFSAYELEIAATVGREVRAALFPELAGKTLGAAIELERVERLSKAFCIPKAA